VIVDLPDTTVSKVSKKLSKLRQEGGVVALGRVLTLVIQTDFRRIEEVVEAANASSRTHPARVIVVADEVDVPGEARLDAQIRVGGDAGASEVVILRAYGGLAQSLNGLVGGLLLPDAPIVVWWPNSCPDAPAESDLGQIATRRITDSANQADPQDYLKQLANNYHPGDGDMAWTRLTLWRSQLASLFDRVSDKKIEKVEIIGSELSPSADLLAAWFRVKLGVPTNISRKHKGRNVLGIGGVKIHYEGGELKMMRSAEVAKIKQTGMPSASILLPRRSVVDCLVEEMRFMGPDETYAEILKGGFR